MNTHSDLVFDIGMHRGRDSRFYLEKGFRVVGVEANPTLVEHVRSELQPWIADGRLILHKCAIAPQRGKADFFVNLDKDDWSSLDSAIGLRHGSRGARIEVPTITVSDLFAQHGTPYYIKIDIEGADNECLAQLCATTRRPCFLSVEAEIESLERLREQLRLLEALGYRRFQIVNQALHRKTRAPSPPREGSFAETRFDGTSSGLFGRELPDRWIDVPQLRRAMARRLDANLRHGTQGLVQGRVQDKWSALHSQLYRHVAGLLGRPLGWYDIHATGHP